MARSLPDGREAAFIAAQRVAHLATADAAGEPSLVPVCYAWDGTRFFTPIDEKPKRRDRPLRRVQNIEASGRAALVFDHYEEDWGRLGWVLVRGSAALLAPGAPGHAEAVALLRARYPQYRAMALESAPLIAITPERVTSWGRLPDG
ncbi:MAG TPA: TIGR03668 family PPOX class F420-dependent oxidoreductase [Thermomicrobiaceae bacterium]|nr:TIGR03668 family PPOX class F420-dependent oxidoreductase [Thermomicrobiaceae bacterium]